MGDYDWLQFLFVGSPILKARACHEVALLAYTGAQVAADLVLNGFLHSVVTVAKDFQQSIDIQREACLAVSMLIGARRVTNRDKSVVCRALVPRDIVGVISQAFHAFPRDPVILEVACTFVANEFNYYRSRMIQEMGTYINLVPLISSAVTNPHLGARLAAVRAISTMADVQVRRACSAQDVKMLGL
jgi:hypothetical protein